MATREQWFFWNGYEAGLAGRLPRIENQWTMLGFGHGGVERAGIFRATKWQGRRRRFVAFVASLRWKLIQRFAQ